MQPVSPSPEDPPSPRSCRWGSRGWSPFSVMHCRQDTPLALFPSSLRLMDSGALHGGQRNSFLLQAEEGVVEFTHRPKRNCLYLHFLRQARFTSPWNFTNVQAYMQTDLTPKEVYARLNGWIARMRAQWAPRILGDLVYGGAGRSGAFSTTIGTRLRGKRIMSGLPKVS